MSQKMNLQLLTAIGVCLDNGITSLVPLPEANCSECTYDDMPNDGGHCYMFKDAPTDGLCGGFEPKRMSMEWK